MAFEDGTHQRTCPSCGAVHAMKWHRMPVREEMRIGCMVCRGTLFNGKTLCDYYDVRLTSTN